jgi:hypothetical protein
MPKLFISHASEDRTLADQVRTHFGYFDERVFIAPDGIPPGEAGWRTIFAAIADSDLFILVATPAACASAAVRREIDEAVRLGRKIVPLRWGIRHDELPESVRDTDCQSFDLKDARDRKHLFNHYGRIAGQGYFWKGVAVTLAVLAGLCLLTR